MKTKITLASLLFVLTMVPALHADNSAQKVYAPFLTNSQEDKEFAERNGIAVPAAHTFADEESAYRYVLLLPKESFPQIIKTSSGESASVTNRKDAESKLGELLKRHKASEITFVNS